MNQELLTEKLKDRKMGKQLLTLSPTMNAEV
jgi:hypothetical protein